MTWYRIDDETQAQTVLIEADSSSHVTQIYLDEYAPDLYVSEARPDTVEDWKADLKEWAKSDQSAIWFR